MERVPARDKYPKAKIEEPNLRLPKAMLKPDGDPNDDLYYMEIFEDDSRRAQHLAEAIAAGAKLDRKVYRVRNKELVKFIGKDFKGMKEIHKASNATIGMLADSESNRHSHSYLDLVGTVEEVSTAEGLILDNILKTYSTLAYPVILMPPTIHGDYIIIPTRKVSRVLGTSGIKLLIMEMETGAWINIESGAPAGRSDQETLINVFGPRENVVRAISLLRAVTYDVRVFNLLQPSEPSDAQEELWREFNEPHWRDFFKRKEKEEEEEAKLKEISGEPEKEKQAEEGGSGEPEKEKHAEEGGSGEQEKEKQAEESGSGEPEIEKQKEDVKEADHKETEKKRPRKLIIRLKKPGGGVSQFKVRTEGEGSRSQTTFLREKSPSKGSKQTEGEFKEPCWSETFGNMKLEGDKETEEEDKAEELSGESEKEKQAEEGGSGEPEIEKQKDAFKEADSKETEEDKAEELSSESEKGQKQAEDGGSGDPEKEKHAEEGGSGEPEVEKQKEDFKKADYIETEEDKAEELSGESEKGQKQAEEGGSGEPEIEKQEDDVKEADSKETEEDRVEELSAQSEKEKQQAEEGGSGEPEKEKQAEKGGSGELEIEKQEDVKEADSKKIEDDKAEELSVESEKGQQQAEEGGSGVTEKEKQPEHVHEEDEDDEKEKSEEEADVEKKECEDEKEKEGVESKEKESEDECGEESVG
ncbi:hypothetical protein LXL04_016747 [Taraxacum kok-saghyz]